MPMLGVVIFEDIVQEPSGIGACDRLALRGAQTPACHPPARRARSCPASSG